MKLKTLTLTDVLCHVSTSIALGENLTVLTGGSDSGKSGAMRGVLQLMRNQPAGIDLLRHGAKRGSCSVVEVAGEDAQGRPMRLSRKRGKSRNEYEVDGQTLVAFGQDVPPIVTEKLRLSEHAFQLQSDGPFLLGATPGAVAKALSATVGLSQIDKALTHVRKLKTDNDTALRCAEADLQRETQALEAYEGLDAAGELVASLETCAEETRAATSRLTLLRDLVSRWEACADTDEADARINECVAALEEMSERWSDLRDAGNNLVRLRHLAAKWKDTPGPAAVGSAGGALRRYEIARKACAAQENRYRAILELNERVAALSDPLDAKLVDEANRAMTEMAAAALDRAAAFDRLNLLSAAEAKWRVVEQQAPKCEAEIATITAAIAEYKKQNPVCPECGADQTNWRK